MILQEQSSPACCKSRLQDGLTSADFHLHRGGLIHDLRRLLRPSSNLQVSLLNRGSLRRSVQNPRTHERHRNTPIGFLSRVIWIHAPNGLERIDKAITGGRTWTSLNKFGNYLFYSKHPLVMIFFLGLITGSVALFVPKAWSQLNLIHKFLIPVLVSQPYLFTYMCQRSGPTAPHIIRSENFYQRLQDYSYDYVLFHPGKNCSTCKFPKPPRSKHCSLCNACVSRSDHHCIWVNNCLGRGNYKYFLFLLLFTAILLGYGAYLGHIILNEPVNAYLERYYPPSVDNDIGVAAFFFRITNRVANRLSAALAIGGVSLTGVSLLALLTAPLPAGLLAYHIYLIWAGTTTNESSKWADLRDDMADGLAYMYDIDEDEVSEESADWPVSSRQFVIVTQDGTMPRRDQVLAIDQMRGRTRERDREWKQVWNLSGVENIYDLGFWDNLMEVLCN